VLGGVAEDFLADYNGIALPWPRPSEVNDFTAGRVFFGKGESALEVAFGCMNRRGKPPLSTLRRLLSQRKAERPSPVVLVVLYLEAEEPPRAAVLAASDETPHDMPADQAERVCLAALSEPDRHVGARTIKRLLALLHGPAPPGVANNGLFASHELRSGVPARPDWDTARRRAHPALGSKGRDILLRLGYEIRPAGPGGFLLAHGGRPRAVAILVGDAEAFDRDSFRFGAVSPVMYGLALAAHERLPWLVLVRGTQMRLYPSSPDAGIGRRGQEETYTELDLAVLAPTDAGYLSLLFGPDALAPGGTADEILVASGNFAADLSERLRRRIYQDVIPGLALAVASRQPKRDHAHLENAYNQALLIMFRILFLAYAEDRGLLPLSHNAAYSRHAVKTLAREFASNPGQTFDEEATGYWNDMKAVWSAVDHGNTGWGVPPYNGGLFSSDSARQTPGAALNDLSLTDAEFGPCLRALLVDSGEDGTDGPVDFRSLGIREFSIIYEGLIDSELAVSQVGLRLAENGRHVPILPGEEGEIAAGQVYLRSRSGRRKATGTYFTKPVIVEHLLDSALEPAITEHLARIKQLLDQGDDTAASEAFYAFRLADPAMGSGHFLVAAIDRIEARFAAFMVENPIASVTHELDLLSQTAQARASWIVEGTGTEMGALLRRQIARRCIYGVDLNPTAVQLARLAVWIHTCVPGLPLPALNLAQGNSLTGIGTVSEVLAVLEPQPHPGQASLFTDEITLALAAARVRLARAARASERDRPEARLATQAREEAAREAAPATALFDMATAVRSGVVPSPAGLPQAMSTAGSSAVQDWIRELQALHMPCLFPEVFIGDEPGFDVILGNPPWEKLQMEEHSFYSLQFPGLRGLDQKRADSLIAQIRESRLDLVAEYEQESAKMQALKRALSKGPYPGLTAGRPDLYKAFAWRMWQLIKPGGYIGVVLPRKALEAIGMKDWRRELLTNSTITDITTLTNRDGWVFDEVHGQYTVALLTVRADKLEASGRVIPMRGPFHSMTAYRSGLTSPSGVLGVDDLLVWSESLAIPQLSDAKSMEIFLAMRKFPRLDQDSNGWSVRGLRELNATDDKDKFQFVESPGVWPVYKGESFDRWNPETGVSYAWANPASIVAALQERRINQVRIRRSAFYQMPPSWVEDPATLPALQPRIAWRDVARATDMQTVVAALIPPRAIMVHQAYYLFWRDGEPTTQAYALGVLSSLPFDWYARQIVESHVTIEFMRSSPVPRPAPSDPLRQRIGQIAGRLAAVDQRYADWADRAGVPVASVTSQDLKHELIAELDAVTALLYGLARHEVEHMFATFHRGWDYRPRLGATLGWYDQWAGIARKAAAS